MTDTQQGNTRQPEAAEPSEATKTIVLEELHQTPGTSGAPAPESAPQEDAWTARPEGKKRRKSKRSATSAGVHLELFRQEEMAAENIDFSTDTSPDFRKRLDLNGRRYQLEKMVAQGGFGEIFLAKDNVLGRESIIKSLKKEYLGNESVMEQFIAEAKLCAQLKHPAIVPIYSLDTDSVDGLHIAMQLIRGITLKVYLRRSLLYFKNHRPSQHTYVRFLRGRLEIFLRICEAVSYCHDRGIIHNDLKPENVMIANFGQVYIMDWGIASCGDISPKKNIQGSVAYMAPERLTSRKANPRTDVFSLGMLLNELATLRGPIRGDLNKVMERICTGDFEPSSCILPRYHISKSLQAVIEKARNPKPELRYPTVKHLADDVRRCLFSEEVHARPDPLPLKVMRYLFHHKTFSFILLLALLTFTAGSIFFSYYWESKSILSVQKAMLQNLALQTETEKTAERVSQRMILLQEQLRNLGSTIQMEMHASPPSEGVTVHMASDLAPRSPLRPRGMAHTAYYRHAVTLDWGVFHRFDGKNSREDLKPWAGCFQRLHSQMLSSMFMDTFSRHLNVRSDKNKLFHLRESLIRRMIFQIGEKCVYCYPGMYEAPQTIESFRSHFIQREFRTGNRLLWAPPFADSSGILVTSCWQSLYGYDGVPLGSMGFDVSFRELLRPVREQMAQEKQKSLYVIVDREDRIIFSSRPGFERAARQQRYEAGGNFYRHPQPLRKIRKSKVSASFPTLIDGKKYRIFWTKLLAADWLLIRHVPEP